MGKGCKAGSDNLDSRKEALGQGIKLCGVLVGSKGVLILCLVDVVVEASKELSLHGLFLLVKLS